MSRPAVAAQNADESPAIAERIDEHETEPHALGELVEPADRRARVFHDDRRHALEHSAGGLPPLHRLAVDAELERVLRD
jgi:hypothetical protein